MPDSLRIVLAIVIVVVLVGIFIFTFLLNKKTPKPEGCQNMEESCEGCQILSCAHNTKKNENKKEEN